MKQNAFVTSAFTLIDFMVVLATLSVIGFCLLGMQHGGCGAKARTQRINCVSNLKQIAQQ